MGPHPVARRIGARLVDVTVLMWLLAIAVVELDGRFGDGDPLATRAIQPVDGGRVLLALAVAVLLLDTLPTAIWGRTPGKALLGLRVVPVLDGVVPGTAPRSRLGAHGAPRSGGSNGAGGDGIPTARAGRHDGGQARVGLIRAVLRSLVLFAPLAVPAVGGPLAAIVACTALVLPHRRGLADRFAGTAVVDGPAGAGGSGRRHRYPRGAIEPLPLPDVARTALVEVGVPRFVPGAFVVDLRMAVFDEQLFSVGDDPTGRALCIVSPTGEVVAIDPDGDRDPLLAGTSLPRFLDALDALVDGGEPAEVRAAVSSADPDAVADPRSWWPTVLPQG